MLIPSQRKVDLALIFIILKSSHQQERTRQSYVTNSPLRFGKSSKRLDDLYSVIDKIDNLTANKNYWIPIKLIDVLHRRKDIVTIMDDTPYKRLRIQVKGRGIVLRDEIDGREIGTKKQFLVKSGQFVLSKIDARNGAVGIIPDECDGNHHGNPFWAYDVDQQSIKPRLLQHLTRSDAFLHFLQRL